MAQKNRDSGNGIKIVPIVPNPELHDPAKPPETGERRPLSPDYSPLGPEKGYSCINSEKYWIEGGRVSIFF
jgi:hypothetical protein